MIDKMLPVWRSLMFCPANAERFIAKAHLRGADAVILDLEDSVASAGKEVARSLVQQAAIRVGQGGADVLVRINRELDLAVADIAEAVCPAVAGLVLPKVAGPEHIRLLTEVILAQELRAGLAPGHTRLVVLVETASAMEVIWQIARADPRIVALAVGGEDLATDLDAEPTADALYAAKTEGVLAARAAGILPLGVLASVAGIADGDAYQAMLRRSRALGFAGATCVHPSHVPLINEAYAPSAEAAARAARLIACFDAAQARGVGAVAFEGSMIDKPVADRARRLLARSANSPAESASGTA